MVWVSIACISHFYLCFWEHCACHNCARVKPAAISNYGIVSVCKRNRQSGNAIPVRIGCTNSPLLVAYCYISTIPRCFSKRSVGYSQYVAIMVTFPVVDLPQNNCIALVGKLYWKGNCCGNTTISPLHLSLISQSKPIGITACVTIPATTRINQYTVGSFIAMRKQNIPPINYFRRTGNDIIRIRECDW